MTSRVNAFILGISLLCVVCLAGLVLVASVDTRAPLQVGFY